MAYNKKTVEDVCVKGKKVLMLDDMIDTAGSLRNAAIAASNAGAVSIRAAATHGVLSGPAIDRINESPIKELFILDTIALDESKKLDKITVVPVAPVFAEAIERIYEDKPVSPLFG